MFASEQQGRASRFSVESISLLIVALVLGISGRAAAQERTSATDEDGVLQCEIQAGRPAQKTCDIAHVTQMQGRNIPLSRIAVEHPQKDSRSDWSRKYRSTHPARQRPHSDERFRSPGGLLRSIIVCRAAASPICPAGAKTRRPSPTSIAIMPSGGRMRSGKAASAGTSFTAPSASATVPSCGAFERSGRCRPASGRPCW
jgi:hypothetical protein